MSCMMDAALYYGERAEQRSRILATLGLESKRYILATLHRQENTDDCARLRDILAGFAKSPKPIIWPLHPRTRKRLADFGLTLPDPVRAIEPVGYLDMVMLEKHAALIATDSGGVQKEAYFHQVSCLTLREETEWVELVEIGANKIVGTLSDAISNGLARVRWQALEQQNLYGVGKAGKRIGNNLITRLWTN